MKFYIKIYNKSLFIGDDGILVPFKMQAKVYEAKDVADAMSELSGRVVPVPLDYIDLKGHDLVKESKLYASNTKFLIYNPPNGVFYKSPYQGTTLDPNEAHQYNLEEVKFYGSRNNWAIPCSEASSEVFVYSIQLRRFLKVDPSSPVVSESELIGREDVSIIL
ncbi:hypothetical protein Phi40:1_gp017 [Cellulophaga phage phi40:1]|uniref:Uncharacterized protein n=1 Tax=Cellulophaga phage phi38:1 TaxID=1327977 RepID=S0A0N8_9CAUD|nr:hypothetical protein Phi38:1_gp017 [Cellulophaga phage phi38:1]AGO47882.1 hypothetical protein Phi40:1_gp017 [Cellulophaga phage phi40:1]AGO48047.1 hypothetical protein Phi38:1_gp017 [Cellulophaga phage phi38:1]